MNNNLNQPNDFKEIKHKLIWQNRSGTGFVLLHEWWIHLYTFYLISAELFEEKSQCI